jgi:hypothetical protein
MAISMSNLLEKLIISNTVLLVASLITVCYSVGFFLYQKKKSALNVLVNKLVFSCGFLVLTFSILNRYLITQEMFLFSSYVSKSIAALIMSSLLLILFITFRKKMLTLKQLIILLGLGLLSGLGSLYFLLFYLRNQ